MENGRGVEANANEVEEPVRKFVDAPPLEGTPPPIDMAHLTRHTLGDEDIAREVLDLFLIEMQSAREVIRGRVETELRDVAHRIKGAARAVGAFGLADIAEDIETAPGDDSLVRDFLGSSSDVESYIRSLSGQSEA